MHTVRFNSFLILILESSSAVIANVKTTDACCMTWRARMMMNHIIQTFQDTKGDSHKKSRQCLTIHVKNKRLLTISPKISLSTTCTHIGPTISIISGPLNTSFKFSAQIT